MESSFDFNELRQEAQRRWLKPLEVFFILKNHEKFPVALEPPKKPPGGSLFLFNRRVLRFFRKDGHTWRRKKDGRAVGEAHERLKVGNVDALNCYYAHGEDNPYFQRRSYWMLDPAHEHIVLVHYREVTEGRYVSGAISNISPESSVRNRSGNASDSQTHSFSSGSVELKPYASSVSPKSAEVNSNRAEVVFKTENESALSQPSLDQALKKLAEQLSLDDEDDDVTFLGVKLPPYESQEDEQELAMLDYETKGSTEDPLEIRYDLVHGIPDQIQDMRKNYQCIETEFLDALGENGMQQSVLGASQSINCCSPGVGLPIQSSGANESIQLNRGSNGAENTLCSNQISQSDFHLRLSAARKFLLDSDSPIVSPKSTAQLLNIGKYLDPGYETHKILSNLGKEGSSDWMDSFALDGKYEGTFPSTLFDQSELKDSSLNTSQRQLFHIREVSPEWAFTSTSTKVIVTGDFLCNPSEFSWGIMFGCVEVPAEVVQEGVLRCQAPKDNVGRVTFCVTLGNRESCSEIREFEFLLNPNTSTSSGSSLLEASTRNEEELTLLERLIHLLFDREAGRGSFKSTKMIYEQPETCVEKHLPNGGGGGRQPDTISWVLQELIKDKLEQWLSRKYKSDASELSSLSKTEQGVIHVVSALGYEWALNPLLSSGVGINFRDSNGWTALHWAAHFGREKMVAALLALGASPQVVTDPTSQYPAGRTPASIAASSGHDGLAGYLSEFALTSHLSSLRMDDSEISNDSPGVESGKRAVENISQRSDQINTSGPEDQLSLKDSLAAVRNAGQAAARIQAAFRAHSFRRKMQRDAFNEDDYGLTFDDIRGLSAVAKSHKGRDQKFDQAALSIQKNYRCWKGRNDFLNLRKNVVKIQAHFRGHQVRKKYKEFIWTVSVVEKVVLRWRRKGVGLRGFRAEQEKMNEEEDEDVVKLFRKEKVEAALDEALTRVVNMVGCPGARQQYRRMLESYRDAKAELYQTDEASPSFRGRVNVIQDQDEYQLM